MNMATAAATERIKRTEALNKRKAWKALQAHYKRVRELHLRELFAHDPKRGERMTAEAAGLFLAGSSELRQRSDLCNLE
jgi:glucose-6-phosphate isomerase